MSDLSVDKACNKILEEMLADVENLVKNLVDFPHCKNFSVTPTTIIAAQITVLMRRVAALTAIIEEFKK